MRNREGKKQGHVTLRKVLRSKKWSAGGERALGDEKMAWEERGERK
jgi:hypothetical protein